MPRKKSKDDFIKRANEIHNNKYDYSKVNYINSKTKVEIVCQKHGSFWQTPNAHLNKRGCPKCALDNSKLTKEEFIKRASKIHNNKYDYSKVNYVNSYTKIIIICPKHGEFFQKPSMHLMGRGCSKCKKLTKEEFIRRASKTHNNKYNYSKVVYKNIDTKIIIICPKHGEFEQRPADHLRGHGCKECGSENIKTVNKLTYSEFIKRANKVHNNKYDYSKVEYKNINTKVIIICPEHGEFQQKPYNHLKGQGCPKCNGGVKLNVEEFINKANKIHDNKYDYSEVNYINTQTKVKIICPIHGEFYQTPNNHLNGFGCFKCGIKKGKSIKQKEDFINDANKVHNNKYNYDKIEYINNRTKIAIICFKHGIFYQRPSDHLRGQGCPYCSNNKRYTKEKFIKYANKIHNNKYDYSKVEYVNNRTKVIIICPTHGEFIQTPDKHLRGSGCPKCYNKISHYEDEIVWFIENNITNNIIRNDRSIIKPYELDIYLPEFNIAIEFNGTYWHSMNRKPFNYHQMKFNLCKEKGIYLIHVFEEDYKKFKDDIFKEIKCCCNLVNKNYIL